LILRFDDYFRRHAISLRCHAITPLSYATPLLTLAPAGHYADIAYAAPLIIAISFTPDYTPLRHFH
jgi:hypothetical protein